MIKRILTAAFVLVLPVHIFAVIQWQTTHGNLNSGQVRLESNKITATVYPNYLDVEEEAVISTQGSTWGSGDPNSLEIYGTFNLPEGSTIVGMLLWNGDIILKAKLKSRFDANQQYEEVVDRNIIPPPRPRDPALIEYMGNNTYQVKIYPVILGNARKIRLRYYIPCSVAPEGIIMNLRSVFAPQIYDVASPITLKLKEGDGSQSYVVSIDGSKRAVTFPATYLLDRTQIVTVAQSPAIPSLMAKTKFASGDFKGNYMNLYANVPDNILDYPGLKLEVVVFWKWHRPYFFLDRESGSNDLSSHGYKAVQQASTLTQLYQSIAENNVSLGMVHDNFIKQSLVFEMGTKNSPEWEEALVYLQRIDADYIQDFAGAIPGPSGTPGKKPDSTASDLKANLNFNLRLVSTLFSAEEGVVRHVIVASAGPIPEMAWDDELIGLFDRHLGDIPDVSISPLGEALYYAYNNYYPYEYLMPVTLGMEIDYAYIEPIYMPTEPAFEWPSLDVDHILNMYAIDGNKIIYANTELPGFNGISVMAVVKSGSNNYNLDVNCNYQGDMPCQPLVFNGKAAAAWSDKIEWLLIEDATGQELQKYTEKPQLVDNNSDKAIATLWAGSRDPFMEIQETFLGATYGFVDLYMSMLALEEDSLGATEQAKWELEGVPLLTKDDIIPPDTGAYLIQVVQPIAIEMDMMAMTLAGETQNIIATGTKKVFSLDKLKVSLVRDGITTLKIILPRDMIELNELTITIYNINGTKIKSWILHDMQQGFLQLQAPDLKPGFYLIRLQGQGFNLTKRIMLH
jgi:hypothetical protein